MEALFYLYDNLLCYIVHYTRIVLKLINPLLINNQFIKIKIFIFIIQMLLQLNKHAYNNCLNCI